MTISFDLGPGYIVSTHLVRSVYMNVHLARDYPFQGFPELARFFIPKISFGSCVMPACTSL